MTQDSGLKSRKKRPDNKPENSPNSTVPEKTPPKEPVRPTYKGNTLSRALAYLFEKEDASYLAVFRILWGSIMMFEAYTYVTRDFEKMYGCFYNSTMTFKYYGFEWCEVPSDPFVMKAVLVAQLIFATMLTFGFFYRTAALLFFLDFSYMYMLEQAVYLNHFYLVCILSAMMILLPCNCLFSLDSVLWPKKVYSATCPKWCLIFVKLELAIVYTYAGVAKINEDWLRGEPLRAWLATREKAPLIGPLLVRESTAYFMSYGGLLYDLIVAELLLFRRTLPFGLFCTVFFHISNKLVFNIGIFPWMMIASTTFFFPPFWPRLLVHKLFNRKKPFVHVKPKTFAQTAPRKLSILEIILLLSVAVFLVHQVLTPLRFHTYPGTVAWNEYGHQFSWRMKLRTKKCDAIAFAYSEAIHEGFILEPQKFLNRRQYRKMASRPDMIMQFAHYLGQHVDTQIELAVPGTNSTTEVYIESWCGLNGREYQALTIPTINIINEPRWDYPYSWVTEVKPLTPEEEKNYPWNFEWNFNWLKGINDRLPEPDEDNDIMRANRMVASAEAKWQNWLIKRDPVALFHPLPRGY